MPIFVVFSVLAVSDLLGDGQRAFQAGDLQRAEALFRQYLKAQPASAEAMSNLAAVLARREQYSEAVVLYRKALKANPRLTPIHFNLGVAQMKSGDYSGCADSFAKFTKTAPNDQRGRQLLGICRVEGGDLKSGIVDLEKIPNPDTSAIFALAVAHARSGDEARAAQLLSRLEANPAQARLVEGYVEYRRERYPEARAKFEEALQFDPKLTAAMAALGRLALHENRDERAISYLERALAANPQDAESVYQLGVLYDRTGRTAEGRKRLERALQLRSGYADPHYQLARIDFRVKDYPAALRHLEAAAAILPKQEAIRLLLARTYQALGRKADADREFTEVRRIKRQIVERDRLTPIP